MTVRIHNEFSRIRPVNSVHHQRNTTHSPMTRVSPWAIALCVGFLLAISGTLHAQTDPTNPAMDIGVKSPTAAAFSSVAELPVDLASGQATFTVPLFTVEGVTLSLPIALSYRTSEINLSAVPSNVGQNWSLQAGGLISRTMFGLPDDDQHGYPFTGYNALQDDRNFYIDDPSAPSSGPTNQQTFIQNIENRLIDVHPDAFSFVSPSGSGQFVWYQPNGFQITPASDFRIERNAHGCVEGAAFPLDTCWVVTAPDGTKYFYEKPEVSLTKSTNVSQGFYHYQGEVEHASSWYLTRVVATGGDVITLVYDTESFYSVIEHLPSERKYETLLATQSGSSSNGGICSGPAPNVSVRSFTGTKNVVLREIVSSKHHVVFNYGWRADIPYDYDFKDQYESNFSPNQGMNTHQEKRLEEVEIKTAEGVLIKRFELNYNGEMPSYNRLRLDEVHEIGADGTQLPPYRFTYYNWALLPDRLSSAVDHWGVYNGATSNQGLTPAIRIGHSESPFGPGYGLGGVNIRGNDREPGGLAEGRAGLLETITYPTGGSSEIEYEAHDFGYQVEYGEANLAGNVVDARHPSDDSYILRTIVSHSESEVVHSCSDPTLNRSKTITFMTPPGSPGRTTVDVEVNFSTRFEEDPVGTYNHSSANIFATVLNFSGGYDSVWRPVHVVGGTQPYLPGSDTIVLDANTTYRLTVSAEMVFEDGTGGPPVINCPGDQEVYASVEIAAYELGSDPTYEENEVAGGARVSRVHTYEAEGATPITTEYSYRLTEGAQANGAKSSGVLMRVPEYARFTGTTFASCSCATLIYLQYGSSPDFARISGPRMLYSQVKARRPGSGSTVHLFTPNRAELEDILDFGHMVRPSKGNSNTTGIFGSSRLTDLSWARGVSKGTITRAETGVQLSETDTQYEITETTRGDLEAAQPGQPRIRGLNYTRTGEEVKMCDWRGLVGNDPASYIHTQEPTTFMHFGRYWVSHGLIRPTQTRVVTYDN